MPVPRFCPNPECLHHHQPRGSWRRRSGSYHTLAHGTVQRYRCVHCGTTMSDQTESIHFFAKRRLPLRAIADTLLGGTSMREVGRRYGVSVMAIQNAVLRLGRQAMAAQLVLLSETQERTQLAIDGLRSFVTSQDYPCDITTTVEREGEVILTLSHAIFRRGGRMRPAQKRRIEQKNRVWRPKPGTMKRAILLQMNELWDYLRPAPNRKAIIDTDENPFYAGALRADPQRRHFALANLIHHIQTPSTAPRTMDNPLFPVNYVDRLLRHRVKEHTRETIAFGRHAVMQMHRAWLFAWDHNCRREHRVKKPGAGVHAVHGCLDSLTVRSLTREFFDRRILPRNVGVPETIREVWLGELQTPPLRWKQGQRGSSVIISDYARRDLQAAYQHGC